MVMVSVLDNAIWFCFTVLYLGLVYGYDKVCCRGYGFGLKVWNKGLGWGFGLRVWVKGLG